jgi:arsenite-transporting ATPase
VIDWVERATRHLFFTGKGGVGKTSLACAVALALADRGKKVLLVSTDPASNLDEVLGQKLASTPTMIPEAPRLFALNIDPEEAARAYREKAISPYRGKLPEAILRSMEEQLSGACTTEIAAFDEFSRLMGDPATTAEFDHVVFDTAPTGHTLRLLTLPKAWTGFLDSNTNGASCLGPLSGLERQRMLYGATVAGLADATQTTLILVSRAEKSSLREAERTSGELAALGINNQRLIINGIFQARRRDDATAVALEKREKEAIGNFSGLLSRMPVTEVPLRAHNVVGMQELRALFQPAEAPAPKEETQTASLERLPFESLGGLVDGLAESKRGVIMTMGKGGVGKTTIAESIAIELARRGFNVSLSTTDPAAHVAAVDAAAVPGLRVSRIDPAVEIRAYAQHVMNTVGKDLDPDARALLEEDLRSPCTEEIAVFRAFARTVADGEKGFVILDTAPTGHTLLLLDATEAYHREVLRLASHAPEEIRQLLPRLRNGDFTKVLIVTLAEPTPVHEAARLQEDLRRAQIEPYAWIINQTFTDSASRDPLLLLRAKGEAPFIQEVSAKYARRAVLVPWVSEEPVGPEGVPRVLKKPPADVCPRTQRDHATT